ncbi:hypothetical protein KY289_027277 [Solanum tuberosum]|nr:hypothetical protein KY289_027277 [Solanum tuberosum]
MGGNNIYVQKIIRTKTIAMRYWPDVQTVDPTALFVPPRGSNTQMQCMPAALTAKDEELVALYQAHMLSMLLSKNISELRLIALRMNWPKEIRGNVENCPLMGHESRLIQYIGETKSSADMRVIFRYKKRLDA